MPNPEKLDTLEIKNYFVQHLNRIYSIKLDIIKKLPQIAENASFIDLKQAVIETCEDISTQVENLLKIYKLIGSKYSAKPHEGSTGMIDDLFAEIFKYQDNLLMRDLSILFYMQNMESIEVCSFKIMHMIADKIGDKAIVQLLIENSDSAKDDRNLMIQINKKYLPNI